MKIVRAGIAVAAILAVTATSETLAISTLLSPQAGIDEYGCPPESPAIETALTAMRMKLIEPGSAIDLAELAKSPALQAARAAENARLRTDWPNLCRYKRANSTVRSSVAPEVIFFGSSGTENWSLGDPQLFSARRLNRGIGGQTSAQLILRLFGDVIDLRPSILHLMIGTNDVAGNNGPVSDKEYENNIQSIVELAQDHHIVVILAALTPTKRFPWAPDIQPVARIQRLNIWLRNYASQRRAVFVDYGAVLRASDGGIKPQLSNDGVHPNRLGYAAMRPLAESAISAARQLGRRIRISTKPR